MRPRFAYAFKQVAPALHEVAPHTLLSVGMQYEVRAARAVAWTGLALQH